MWLAKVQSIKDISTTLNYKMAEDLINTILTKIEKESPLENPLYFAPNLLLLVVEIYELSKNLESMYTFLTSLTEKLRE